MSGCHCSLVVAAPTEPGEAPCEPRVSGTVRPLARHSLTRAAKMGGSPWAVLAKSPCGACLPSFSQRRRPVVTLQSMPVQRDGVRGWYALGPAWPHRVRLLPSFGGMRLSDEIVTETPGGSWAYWVRSRAVSSVRSALSYSSGSRPGRRHTRAAGPTPYRAPGRGAQVPPLRLRQPLPARLGGPHHGQGLQDLVTRHHRHGGPSRTGRARPRPSGPTGEARAVSTSLVGHAKVVDSDQSRSRPHVPG